MKRGDIVLAAASGDYGKARPFVVIQADDTIDLSDSLILCPITSHLTGSRLRLRLEPGPETGLRIDSEVMVEKVITLPKGRIRTVVGRLSERQLAALAAALMVVLDLPA